MENEYTFTPIQNSEAELRQVSDFLRGVFPHARHVTPAYLRWLYVDNPQGTTLGFNAYHRGELVAHSAGQPLAAMVEGEPQRGIFIMNSGVHPRHIRHKVMQRLTDPQFEEAARQGYSFAMGMGNFNSTKPLLTRCKMVGPLEARLGFGHPRRHTEEITPSFSAIWTEESLRWRLANPERRYATKVRDGRLVVTAPTGKPGIGAIIYEGDAMGVRPDEGSAASGPLKLWIGRDPRIAWGRSSFLPIPMRLRPSPLNFVFKDLTGRGVHPDPARVIFQALDFDAY